MNNLNITNSYFYENTNKLNTFLKLRKAEYDILQHNSC